MKLRRWDLVLLLGLITFSFFASGQHETNFRHHELRAQISDGATISIVSSFGAVFNVAFDNLLFNSYERESEGSRSFGHIGIGYRYYFGPRFNIGGNLSYQRIVENYKLTSNYTGEVLTGFRYTNAFLLMGTAELIYLRKQIVRLYGNLALGVGSFLYGDRIKSENYESEMNYVFLPAFQINPIGIRVGKQVAGYLELGIGYQGIFTLGLSVQL